MSHKETFQDFFGQAPEVESKANGRVNLIGEHTDYNGGFVLPTCIPQETRAAFRRREDDVVRLASLNMAGEKSLFQYKLGTEHRSHGWTDYVQGVTQLLKNEGFELSGFDCLVESDVPMGSGLSSSAALEVAVMKGLGQLFRLNFDPLQVAKWGQRVENEFVGARVGIMDQMIISLGAEGKALFIDTQDFSFETIPVPTDRLELLVINSGVSHSHSTGGYNQRRSECEQACEILNIPQLRNLDLKDLPKLEILPDLLKRRARHVITENARVGLAADALKKKECRALGELFYLSHLSMRDDYEVSVPEIDLLVEICQAQSEVFGARLTGGGFGGSIVAITGPGKASLVGERVRNEYDKRSGKTATVLVPQPPVEESIALWTEKARSH